LAAILARPLYAETSDLFFLVSGLRPKKIVDDGPEAVNLHYMVVRVFTKMEHNERSLVMKDPPYEL